jgi:WD40 repeat protein
VNSSNLRRIISRLAAAGFLLCASHLHLAQTQPGRESASYRDDVFSVRFSPDGQLLAIARGTVDSGRVELWDTQTGKLRLAIAGFDGPVLSVSFSPDGRTLLTGSREYFQSHVEKSPLRGRISAALKWWDVRTGELKRQVTVPGNDRLGVKATYSPDGRLLAALEYYWTFRVGLGGYFDGAAPPFSSTYRMLSYEADLSLRDSQTGEIKIKLKKGLSTFERPLTLNPRSLMNSLDRFGLQRLDHAVFAPNGRVIAVWNSKEVVLWDTGSGSEIQTLDKFNHQLSAIAFSPDGRTLAAAFLKSKPSRNLEGLKSEIRFYDITTGEAIRAVAPRSLVISSLTFDLAGKTLVAGGWQRDGERQNATLELVDPNKGSLGGIFTGDEGAVTSMVLSPNGRSLAWQANASTVELLDTQTWSIKQTFDANSDTSSSRRAYSRFFVTVKSVQAVAFSADGKGVIGKIEEGGVRVWDSRTGEVKKQLAANEDPEALSEISANGNTSVEVNGDGVARVTNLRDGSSREISVEAIKPGAIALSEDGATLAVSSQDQIALVDVASAKVTGQLTGAPAYSDHLRFSTDGRYLAAGNAEGTIKIWDVIRNQSKSTLTAAGQIMALRFAPDGHTLASADKSGVINLWNLQSGARLIQLNKHKGAVNAIAFSADGQLIASGGDDRSTIIWDAASGKPRRTLKGHDLVVTSLAFSPDGSLIACGSGNASVVVWDVESGRPERILR